MDNTARARQRVLALVLPVAAVLYVSAEALGHVSTADTACDLNLLRQALGQPKLDYLGISYGTFLGATCANLFPRRAGRLVLDGNG